MDSQLITSYVEHLLELYPTIRLILVENIDIFFKNSDKYYAKSFYKKSYMGRETDYRNVCQVINYLTRLSLRFNTRVIVGLSKIEIIPVSIPLPRGFEFGKEVRVVDPVTEDLTTDVRIIERMLDPAETLLNLQGFGFIKALKKS